MAERMSTPAQRRAIVVAGKRRGLDLDDLRAMTSAGSLRELTFAEASELIDRISVNPPPWVGWGSGCPARGNPSPARGRSYSRCPRGVVRLVTPKQREVIEIIRDRLGWTPEHLDNFLRKTFGFDRATLARRHDASRAIEVLNRVVDHAERKATAKGT